jgi:hypothetical protein
MISSINEVVFTSLVYIIISTLDLKGLAHLLRHSESTQRLNSSSISVLFFTPIHSISLVSGTTILEMKEQGLLQMHSIRILLYKNFGLSIYRIDIFYTSPALIAIRLEIVVLNLWQWLVKLIEVFRFCRKRADRDSSHLIGPPRLNDNNFSHDGTRAIADMLKLNSTITCLLSVNFEFLTRFICIIVCKIIILGMKESSRLLLLYESIKHSVAYRLLNLSIFISDFSLRVDFNKISPVGAYALGEALKVNTALEVIK